MTDIILLEPENAGNIGAIARTMLNFGFEQLMLINPQCKHLSQEAKDRAKHAQKILETARVATKNALKEASTFMLTTSYKPKPVTRSLLHSHVP